MFNRLFNKTKDTVKPNVKPNEDGDYKIIRQLLDGKQYYVAKFFVDYSWYTVVETGNYHHPELVHISSECVGSYYGPTFPYYSKDLKFNTIKEAEKEVCKQYRRRLIKLRDAKTRREEMYYNSSNDAVKISKCTCDDS